jgi:outer membrane protein
MPVTMGDLLANPIGARGRKTLASLFVLFSLALFHVGAAAATEGSGHQTLPPQPLTLDQAVEYGLDHNPLLHAAEQDLRAADQGVSAARAGFLPRLDTHYSYTNWRDKPFAKVEQQVGPAVEFQTADTNLNHWQAELTQPLFQGFRTTAQYGMAEEQRNIAGYRKTETRLNLVRNIRSAFIQVLLGQRTLQVAEASVAQLQAHLKDAEAFFAQGLTPRNDVLKAEVALANAKQQETRAAKRLVILRAQLNRLLGLDERTELALAEWSKMPAPDDGTEEVPPLQELWVRAERTRPELAAISASIRETKEGARLAGSTGYPRFSLFTLYYREGGNFLASENDFANEHNAAVGVRVDWNLFEGGRMRAEIMQWYHKRAALEQREQDLLKQVLLEVEDAYEQLQVAKTNLATARVAVKQAEENLRITTLQYQEQIVISTEVLDAEVYLTQARTNYYQALYGYQLAWADLERAVGEAL